MRHPEPPAPDNLHLLAVEVGRLGAHIDGLKHSQNLLIGAMSLGFALISGVIFFEGNSIDTQLQGFDGRLRQFEQELAVLKERTQSILTNTEELKKRASLDERAGGSAPMVAQAPTAGTARGADIDVGVRPEALIGRNVIDAHGRAVGEIETVVLGQNQQPVEAIVSIGGFLGIGEKNVAIPLDKLRLGHDNMVLMVETSADQLKQMPAVDWSRYQSGASPPSSTGAAMPTSGATSSNTGATGGSVVTGGSSGSEAAGQTDSGSAPMTSGTAGSQK